MTAARKGVIKRAKGYFKKGNTLWRQRKEFDDVFMQNIGNARNYNRPSALTQGKAGAVLISSLRPIEHKN